MPYKPSQSKLDKILISLSVHSNHELALPGNWSGDIFVSDLFSDPVESKDKLCNVFHTGLIENWSYRKFFEESRSYPRPNSDSQIWDIFDSQLMMVGEPLFLDLLKNQDKNMDVLILYLTKMSEHHISTWNDIVKQAGACCWEFFIEDPWSYMNLINSQSICKTDFDMLDQLGIKFSALNSTDTPCSRKDLVRIFESRFGQSHLV